MPIRPEFGNRPSYILCNLPGDILHCHYFTKSGIFLQVTNEIYRRVSQSVEVSNID